MKRPKDADELIEHWNKQAVELAKDVGGWPDEVRESLSPVSCSGSDHNDRPFSFGMTWDELRAEVEERAADLEDME